MEWLRQPQGWISLLTLTSLEIVLGIDNIIFIALLAGRLPERDQGRARTLGLSLAMFIRILLLLSITWIMQLTGGLSAAKHGVTEARGATVDFADSKSRSRCL